MPDDIPSQIDHIADRRLLGCVGRFVLSVVLAGVAAGIIVKLAPRGDVRVVVGLAFSGFVLSLATSILTPQSRRLLRLVFTVAPLIAALTMTVWSLLGYPLSLRLALAPLAFCLGFVLGQPRHSRA
jgi:hypothetical protein